MYRKTTAVLILAVLFAAGGCTPGDRQSASLSGTAPDFTLPDLNGRNVRLADLKGKVVLVEFWATWCGPCRESIPGIERLYQSYGRKGLVVLGISVDEGDVSDLKAFARANRMTYTVLQGDEDTAQKYRVRAIPALFLVNKEGIVVKQYIGEGFMGNIEQDVRSLL